MPKFLNLISQSGKKEFVDMTEFNKNPNAYGKYKVRMVDDSTGKNYNIPATMLEQAQKDGLRAWKMDKQTAKPQPTTSAQPTTQPTPPTPPTKPSRFPSFESVTQGFSDYGKAAQQSVDDVMRWNVSGKKESDMQRMARAYNAYAQDAAKDNEQFIADIDKRMQSLPTMLSDRQKQQQEMQISDRYSQNEAERLAYSEAESERIQKELADANAKANALRQQIADKSKADSLNSRLPFKTGAYYGGSLPDAADPELTKQLNEQINRITSLSQQLNKNEAYQRNLQTLENTAKELGREGAIEAQQKDSQSPWFNNPFANPYLGSNERVSPSVYQMNKKQNQAATIGANVNTARTLLREASLSNDSFYKQLGRGLLDAAFDINTWDAGLTAVNQAVTTLMAKQAYDKDKATAADMAVLESSALKNIIASDTRKAISAWYNAGVTTTNMIPFMAYIAASPFNNVGRAFSSSIGNALLNKSIVTLMRKGLSQSVYRASIAGLKGIGRFAGDVVGGSATALTFGNQVMLGDAINRYQGQHTGQFNAEGRFVYTGSNDAKGIPQSLLEAFATQAIEYQSELVGEYFTPVWRALGKGMGKGVGKALGYTSKEWFDAAGNKTLSRSLNLMGHKISLDKTVDLFSRLSNKESIAAWNKFLKSTKQNGVLGEYLEEVIGNMENATLGINNANWGAGEGGVFNPEENMETFLAVAVGTGFMTGIGGLAGTSHRSKLNRAYNRANENGMRDFGWDSWVNIREQIDNAAIGELPNIVTNLMKGMNKRQAQTIQNYAAFSVAKQGSLIADFKEELEKPHIARVSVDNSDPNDIKVTSFDEQNKPLSVKSFKNEEDAMQYQEMVHEYINNGKNMQVLNELLATDEGFEKAMQIVNQMNNTAEQIGIDPSLPMDINYIAKLFYKDPLKRTDDEQLIVDSFVATANNVAFPSNEVNTNHEHQQGQELAEGSEIGDQTSIDTVNQRETAAIERWNNIADPDLKSSIATLVANGSNENQIIEYLRQNEYSEDIIEAFAELCNAKAFKDGFIANTGIKISEEVQRKVASNTFSGQLNGEESPIIISVQDQNGATLFVVGGNISLDEQGILSSDGLVILRDEQGNFIQRQDMNDLTLLGTQTAEEYQNALLTQTQEAVTAQIQSTEYNDSDIESNAPEMPEGSGLTLQPPSSPTPPTTPQTPQIPLDENGNKDYTKAPVEDTIADITAQFNGNQESANAVIKSMADQANADLDAAKKKKDKGPKGKTVEETIKNQQDLDNAVADAQSKADYWQEVLDKITTKTPPAEGQPLQPPTQDLQPPTETKPTEYHKLPIEETIKKLYGTNLDDNEINDLVSHNIKKSFKELEAIKAKKPKMDDKAIDGDIDKYTAAKEQWQQQVNESQQKLDYWHNVEQYIQQQTHTTDAEIKAAQDELSGTNAQAEFAAQNGEGAKTPVQVAGEFIKDAKLLSADFRKETGLGRKEEQQFPGMFASNGKTIAQLAEALVSHDNDTYNGMFFKGDDMAAKDAIIEALQTAGGRASLGQNTSAEFEAFDRERTQQREDYYEEAYHMSYSDYLAFEEQQMPSIWRRISNFAPEQYDQMVAEHYESLPEDYFTQQNQNNNGTEQNPPVAGSNEILPQPQVDNQAGTGQRQDPAAETGNGGKGNNPNDEVPGGTQGVDTKQLENQQKTDEKSDEPPTPPTSPTPPTITEQDIDADEIADENAKELAKDFLRGENTGTIAELFYREIAGRIMNKKTSEQKPENKPASEQKPKTEKPKSEQKPESKPKTQAPKTDTPKQEMKSDTKQAFDEFKDVMEKFRNAGHADANVSLIGLNARQIEMLADVFRATAKLGYAMIKDGATVFNDWLEKMRAMVSDTIKTNSKWNDQDITDLLTETWNNKYLVDGVRKPLSEWAAEEALNTEQDQEKKEEEKAPAQPATVPDNSVVGQTQFPYTKEELEAMTKEQMISAMWQNVFPTVCQKHKVPSDVLDENAYWFAPKMTTGYTKDSLVAACMKYMEHLNDEVAQATEKQMNYIMSLAAEDEKRLFRDITLTKTAASRVIDLLKQEENMTYGKSGSAEDFVEIANELEKIARLNGADLSQKDQKQAERQFVNNAIGSLQNALQTGEKPFKSITDIRKAAREDGMDIEDGKDDIKLQELVEDALVKVSRDIMTEARVPGQRDMHKFRKETFEKIKLLYNLQPTISMRSSNRVALQQYSTPLPMAFCADMFASGRTMRIFYSAFEPTAGNGMLVFGIPSNRVHVNEIDENRLENLRGQGFKKVTSQDATMPFESNEYYDAIITNPPFGEVAAKDYDGYQISGLAPQIALNALERMKDNGRAVIIIGGEQKFASNGAIQNDKPFLAYLYNHYNVKGVIDMDGSLYAKQGTTFPTRMILIDGRRTEEERAKSDVYPPVQKNWITKADSFDKLYDTVNELLNSKQKTNGTEIVRPEKQPLQPDRGITETRDGDTGTDSRKPVPDVATTGGGNGSNGSTGKGSKRGSTNIPPVGGVQLDGSGNVSDGEQTGDGRPTGGDNGRGGEGIDNRISVVDTVSGVYGPAARGMGLTQKQEKRKLESEKLSYRPHNTAFSLESVAPAAMVEAMDKTLKRIEEEYGDIDNFVTSELGYDSVDAMHKALAAEQVDSVAMAIYNMKKGEALVIGDQTGVGKGRQMAALIRWAVRQGKKPVFMTQKSNLFNDIYRDLKDIGSENLKPFIFNNDKNAKISEITEDENGNEKEKIIYRSATEKDIADALKNGKVPDGYDFVLCTYSQVSTGDSVSREYEDQINSQETGDDNKKRSRSRRTPKPGAKPKKYTKATLLRTLAKDNYLMLDESHTAAGESNQGYYMQTLVRDSKAVTFASATYAKRPDTMPLYAMRTAMSKANIGMRELIGAIQKGGVTLQEIMSRALSDAGQMVRRERDMNGVVTDWTTIDDPETVKRARENYDKTIQAFNAIIDFQNTYFEAYLESQRESLAVMAGNAGYVRGTEKMGINNTPFASKIYNYTKQLMLALKVDSIVDEVERQIKEGRKPVIALDNTMGSIIDELAIGEELEDSTFAASLLRGLESVMQYTQSDGMGGSLKIKIHPHELGAEGETAYYQLVSFIKESTKNVFISPLDEIINKLRTKGYKVGELTGRDKVVVEENGKYYVAKKGKTSKQLLQSRFNNNKLDCLIINKTGATGISLHASKTFADQRQRVMILAQPLPDINDYMQMIGRIDRTGQVQRGYYISLGLPVPAEQRFLMMLSTKLKSLNANTTTSQDNKDNNVDAPDMLNKYGSQVIVEYFKDHPDIYNKLDDPLRVRNTEGGLSEYITKPDDTDARKLTGHVALLSTEEQQAFYDDVVERYNTLIKYLDDTGTNDLKITSLPLNAKTLAKAVSSKGTDPEGNNPFAKNAYCEMVEMDVIRKPMKADEIRETISSIAKRKDPQQAVRDIRKQFDNECNAKEEKQKKKYEEQLERNREELKKYSDKINSNDKMSKEEKEQAIENKRKLLQEAADMKNDTANRALNYDWTNFTRLLDLFNVGDSYLVPDNLDILSFETASNAIFLGYKAKDSGITQSSTVAVFATLDGRRKIEVKLSEHNKLRNIYETTSQNYDAAQEVTLDNWDNNAPNQTRKTGYIMTGNILQAIKDTQDENGAFPGQLVSYTDSEGNINDGILMPDKWQPSMMINAGKPISEMANLILDGNSVISTNGEVEIKVERDRNNGDSYILRVPRSKKTGQKYWENRELLDAVNEKIFYQSAGKFQVYIPKGKLNDVLAVLDKIGVKVASNITEELNASTPTPTRLAYSNSTNNVNNSRIIPEDVDKSLSLQIESEFDSSIENATKELSEKDKRYVMSPLLAEMNSFAHMQQWKLEEEYQYYKQQVEQDERKNQRNLQVQRPSGRKTDRGISEAQNIALLACIERERSYRERRAVRLSESLGLTAGKPITIDELDKIYKQINKDHRLNKIFDKTISIAKHLGSSIEVAKEDASGKGNFGESGTKRDLHYYIEAFCRTASSEQELPVVILHELIHQATTGAISIVKKGKAEGILTKLQIDAVNTIFDIYNKSLNNKNLFSENDRGLLNEYEFAAQMADPRQRRALQGFDKEDLSVLDRIIRAAKQLKSQGDTSLWDRIKKAIKTLLNIPDALDKMDEAIDILLDTFNENVNDILMNDIDQNDWGYTSTQLFDKYPTWLSGQTTGTGQHTTQITSTVNTYKKIGDWMKSQGMDGASVLDASSGLGKGTEALRDMGFNVEDVEPYPSENRTAPTYLKYEDINGKYDVVISNAVLNVIPDDWRADVLKNMADKVKPGGKMIINVRDAKEIERQKQKIELDSPSEILVTDKAGNIRAYQKGFTQKELADWIQSELGKGWTIDTAKPSNSGISGRAVVVTRNTDTPLAYRRIENQFSSPRARRVSDENQSQMRAHAEAIAEKLNTKLTFTTSDKLEGEKKTAKGWYNKKTGQVVIVLDNNKDNFDIEQTVIHETVGHKGLRALLGSKGLYRLLDSIYANLDQQAKQAIDEATRRNGWRQYTAIEEYLAEQAENTVWDAKSASLWQNVKHYLTEALRTLGFMIRPNLKDARYWLWLSKNNLKRSDVISEIKRNALLNKIERMSAPVLEESSSSLDTEIMLSQGNYSDYATYSAIEERLKKNRQYWTEAYVDYMNSYRIFQEEMAKGLKNGLLDNQNAYTGENHISSTVSQRQTNFLNRQVKRLQKEIEACKAEFGEGEKGVKNVEKYLTMKHGLERNRVSYIRDNAKKAESMLSRLLSNNPNASREVTFAMDEYYDYFKNEKDYLTSMLSNGTINLQQFYELWDSAIRDYRFMPSTNTNQGVNDAFDSLNKWYDENVRQDYDPNKNDKSGLSAYSELFASGSYEDATIINEVMTIENMLGQEQVDKLISAVQDVTQFAVETDYKGGLVAKELMDNVQDMFNWYIPLRGFDGETMEDTYTYMTNSDGIGNRSVVAAGGRKSKARSPLATAIVMALSSISRAEKNLNKQRAYRMINQWQKDNPDSMPPATIVNLWSRKTIDKNGNEIFKIVTPNITNDMSEDEIRQTIENFENDMKTLERTGDARKEKSSAQFAKAFESKNHKREHMVPLMINGKGKLIIFNGNPRPAQALRGDLAPTVATEGVFEKIINTPMRLMASAFTSYNPSFIATNLLRDTGFANNNIAIKESPKYYGKFLANQAALLTGNFATYVKLFKKYKKGETPTTEMEQYFYEFMDNGGKTGFVNEHTIDKLEKKLAKDNTNWNPLTASNNILKHAFDFIESANERIENINRFAAYMTSRQSKRSVMRSIADAKDVSVNFNRKGAGRMTAQGSNITSTMKTAGYTAAFARSAYLFFNAGVQSLALLGRNIKQHPAKTTAFMVGIPIALGGFIIPMINQMIANAFGDGDDDPYANLPEWTRRNNICIYIGKGSFIKIPLAIELRAFYGLGDIAAGYLVNEKLKSTKNIALDVASQLSQILPIDFLGEGGNTVAAFTPDALKPYVQWINNRDWTGKPIYKNSVFTKYDPEYTKVYSGEFEPFVNISKWINEMSGGTEMTKGALDGEWNNPALWHHIMQGYGGGFITDILRATKIAKRLVTADFKDLSAKEIPVVKAIFDTPTEKTQYYRAMNKFYMYKEKADKFDHDLRKWKESADPLVHSRYLNHTNPQKPSVEYRRMQWMKKYDSVDSKINKALKNPQLSEEYKEMLQEYRTRMKLDVVKRIEELE